MQDLLDQVQPGVTAQVIVDKVEVVLSVLDELDGLAPDTNPVELQRLAEDLPQQALRGAVVDLVSSIRGTSWGSVWLPVCIRAACSIDLPITPCLPASIAQAVLTIGVWRPVRKASEVTVLQRFYHKTGGPWGYCSADRYQGGGR